MKQEILNLLDSHRNWLSGNTTFTVVDDYVEINLPFLNRHNDYIQVYLVKKGNNYTLSDDGETIDDLKSYGLEFKTANRQRLLRSALIGFRVENDNGILKVDATAEDFGFKLNRLIQAILAVNELLTLARPIQPSNFQFTVEDWLKENNVQFHGSKNIVGKSGLNHSFDFTIVSPSNNQSQMVKLVDNPSLDNARKVAFTSVDIRQEFTDDTELVAILNDRDHRNIKPFSRVLSRYDIETVQWSIREGSFTKFKTLKSTNPNK